MSARASLSAQQQTLLHALYAPWDGVATDPVPLSSQKWPETQYLRGLQAYRSNAALLSAKVLGEVYPAVRGELDAAQEAGSFDALAQHLWRSSPPERGDLAQWGGCLVDFLRGQTELLQDLPHLLGLAELEWTLHTAATLPDDAQDPEGGMQVLALLQSTHPIVSCWNYWQAPAEDRPRQEFAHGSAENALVYRQGYRPLVLQLDAAQAAAFAAG